MHFQVDGVGLLRGSRQAVPVLLVGVGVDEDLGGHQGPSLPEP